MTIDINAYILGHSEIENIEQSVHLVFLRTFFHSLGDSYIIAVSDLINSMQAYYTAHSLKRSSEKSPYSSMDNDELYRQVLAGPVKELGNIGMIRESYTDGQPAFCLPIEKRWSMTSNDIDEIITATEYELANTFTKASSNEAGSDEFRQKLQYILQHYEDEFKTAWATNNFSQPIRYVIDHELHDLFDALPFIKDGNYRVKASSGVGRMCKVPWVAFFTDDSAKSAQQGVYPVYLLNAETQTLFLSLLISETEVVNRLSTYKKARNIKKQVSANNVLKETAARIRKRLPYDSSEYLTQIFTANAGYNAGTILAVEYHIDELPCDESLGNDLQKMLIVYQDYRKLMTSESGYDLLPQVITNAIRSLCK